MRRRGQPEGGAEPEAGAEMAASARFTYHVAGWRDCPFYSKARKHAGFVSEEARKAGVADFAVETVELEDREAYLAWLAENRERIKAPKTHKTSPAVWREARGGAVTFVGGFDALSMDLEVMTGGRTWHTSGTKLSSTKGREAISMAMIALDLVLALGLVLTGAPKEYRWYVSVPITIATITYGQLVVSA
ncbi:Hypothetical Protein FCC1311_064962 [Hondaea fermentalgiana]|uniref:Uncharacterized protein n=1 Tax=Hondaea fermentalgiana TaxID=2315210 RepID=A0A2R5GHA6_9STRA|nr:Hypothetical Protein FCC1311_064962 [Hondaea fermentalgiana]|eukprot:GBG30277.1 Hypothetical Protein FCC1311_064962 [Hondaea fermentalgiana]